MKRLLFAAMMLVAVTAQAPSASAQLFEFRGVFVVTALNQACEEFWDVGDTATARFFPPRMGDNGPYTILSYFFRFFAEKYTLPKGNLTNKFKKVSGAAIGWGLGTFEAKMRLTKLSPKNIKKSTTFIDMQGQIQDFDGLAGCNITFRGTFTRRV